MEVTKGEWISELVPWKGGDNPEIQKLQSLNDFHHLMFVDFPPKLLEDCRIIDTFRDFTLGPKFEDLDEVLWRANNWLVQKPHLRVVSCETVEFERAHSVPRKDKVTSFTTRNHSGESLRFEECITCLKVLRLWVTTSSTTASTILQHLGYHNVVPQRLETDPSQLVPKFGSLADAMFKFEFQQWRDPIPGSVLNTETSYLRLTHENCAIDPDGMFWAGSKDRDMYSLSYMRIFFIQGPPSYDDIGFKDFLPRCLTTREKENGISKAECFDEVVNSANSWIKQQKRVRVTNVQTFDHKLYSEYGDRNGNIDTNRSLFVHFPLKPTYHLRLLRVYYVKSAASGRDMDEGRKGVHCKTFTALCPVPGSNPDEMWNILLENLYRAGLRGSRWIQLSGARVFNVETVKIQVPKNRRKINVEECYSVSEGPHGERLVYAIRVYYTGSYYSSSLKKLPKEKLTLTMGHGKAPPCLMMCM